MSIQAFSILKRVAEVDRLLSTEPRSREIVREVHPEVCFFFLNGRRPLLATKRAPEGREERLALLRPWFASEADRALGQRSALRCKADDIIDALVGLSTAERILRGEAVTLPANPPIDERGIPMEMVA